MAQICDADCLSSASIFCSLCDRKYCSLRCAKNSFILHSLSCAVDSRFYSMPDNLNKCEACFRTCHRQVSCSNCCMFYCSEKCRRKLSSQHNEFCKSNDVMNHRHLRFKRYYLDNPKLLNILFLLGNFVNVDSSRPMGILKLLKDGNYEFSLASEDERMLRNLHYSSHPTFFPLIVELPDLSKTGVNVRTTQKGIEVVYAGWSRTFLLHKTVKCSNDECKRSAEHFVRCDDCRNARYCSIECLDLNRESHRNMCKPQTGDERVFFDVSDAIFSNSDFRSRFSAAFERHLQERFIARVTIDDFSSPCMTITTCWSPLAEAARIKTFLQMYSELLPVIVYLASGKRMHLYAQKSGSEMRLIKICD